MTEKNEAGKLTGNEAVTAFLETTRHTEVGLPDRKEEILDTLFTVVLQINAETNDIHSRSAKGFKLSQVHTLIDAVRDESFLSGLREGLRMAGDMVSGRFLGEETVELPSKNKIKFIAGKRQIIRARRYRLPDEV